MLLSKHIWQLINSASPMTKECLSDDYTVASAMKMFTALHCGGLA